MFIKKFVSVFAPERCVGCSKVSSGLCRSCLSEILKPPSRCYRCHKTTIQYQVCEKCRKLTKLNHVWVVSDYSGLTKDIIGNLKFQRADYLANNIALLMHGIIPILPANTLVSYAPTANARIRIRGYDQSKIIAKNLAKISGFRLAPLFIRLSNTRQLGSSREKRFAQAKGAFKLNTSVDIRGVDILLVDDVLTSGATIETLAQILKKNGAKTVDAIVFAQAID